MISAEGPIHILTLTSRKISLNKTSLTIPFEPNIKILYCTLRSVCNNGSVYNMDAYIKI